MNCLNASGVWCSNSYSYNVTTGAVTQSGGTVAINLAANIPTGTSSASITKMTAGDSDRGTCCGTTGDFFTYVGKLGTAGALPAGATSAGSTL